MSNFCHQLTAHLTIVLCVLKVEEPYQMSAMLGQLHNMFVHLIIVKIIMTQNTETCQLNACLLIIVLLDMHINIEYFFCVHIKRYLGFQDGTWRNGDCNSLANCLSHTCQLENRCVPSQRICITGTNLTSDGPCSQYSCGKLITASINRFMILWGKQKPQEQAVQELCSNQCVTSLGSNTQHCALYYKLMKKLTTWDIAG